MPIFPLAYVPHARHWAYRHAYEWRAFGLCYSLRGLAPSTAASEPRCRHSCESNWTPMTSVLVALLSHTVDSLTFSAFIFSISLLRLMLRPLRRAGCVAPLGIVYDGRTLGAGQVRRPLPGDCLPHDGLPATIPGALADTGELPPRRYPDPPDPLAEAVGYPVEPTRDIAHPLLNLPRGPPPPTPVRLGATVRHVNCTALALCPGFLPEILKFPLGLPCDIEDLTDEAERHLGALRLPFCDRVLAVRPQPVPMCATLLVVPSWVAFAAISAVCLDLRNAHPNRPGPLLAVYVTRPTCRAELLRQAGLFGTHPCRLYLGTETRPLEEDEAVTLSNGCVITFVGDDTLPDFSTDLQYRLQLPHMWPDHPPHIPTVSRQALLLLHRTGRFLYKPQVTDTPLDEAAALFIGVNRNSVEIHTPADEGCDRLCHQGVGVRGVLAFIEPTLLPPDCPQYVVFLDLRQVASSLRFLVLGQPFIPREDLAGLVSQRPPPGWFLRVTGGRLRRRRLDFRHGATLVFGFEYSLDSDQPSEHFSPTTDDSDEDSEEDEHSEGQDTTTAPADSDGEHLFPDDVRFRRSASRSRSRTRHNTGNAEHIPFPIGAAASGMLCLVSLPSSAAADIVRDTGIIGCGSGILSPMPALTWLTWPASEVSILFVSSALFVTALGCFTAAYFRRKAGLQPRGCKLLTNPVCRHAGDRRRLENLRRVTRDFGDPWPFPDEGDPFRLDRSPSDSASDASDSESIAWATILVYAPQYAPEWLTLAFHFPSTPGEGIRQIQAERDPRKVRTFPDLVPASPQTFEGAGIYLALPPWPTEKRLLYLDAVRWDGRHFSAFAPPYVDRRTALHLLDLPASSAVQVYVGPSLELLEGDTALHVCNGLALIFVPSPVVLPSLITIEHMLQRPSLWSQHFELSADDRVAFCVACEHQHVLLTYEEAQPALHRQHLARALGTEEDQLAIYPARPRVSDAMLNGVPCRTVLAAAIKHPTFHWDRDCHVILDCRAFDSGWFAFPARGGFLEVDQVNIVEPHGTSLVEPGQVLLCEVSPPTEGMLHGDREPTGTSSAHQPAPSAAPATSTDSRHPATGQDHVQEATSLTEHDTHSPSNAVSSDGFVDAPFMILVPEYTPEIVRVRVSIPQDLHATLARVSAGRLPHTRRRFPRLIPVFTQTSAAWGTLIAAPVWETVGVIICIESRLDGRLFALDCPPLVRRQDILRLAGLEDDNDAFIFHNDTPWPLQHDTRLMLQTADLILILPPVHNVVVTTHLPDMLLSTAGWNPRVQYPADFRDHSWILADSAHFAFLVRRGRRHVLRQDLALVLRCPPTRLLLRPAVPSISNHMHAGSVSKAVLVAHILEEDLTFHSPRAPLIIIDQRPILLGFSWVWVPSGRLDPASLLPRYVTRCPVGHTVGCTRDDGHTEPFFSPFDVRDGEVIEIEYLTHAEARATMHPHDSGPSDPPDSSDSSDAEDSSDDGRDASSTDRSAGAAASHGTTPVDPDAGTGGSTRFNVLVGLSSKMTFSRPSTRRLAALLVVVALIRPADATPNSGGSPYHTAPDATMHSRDDKWDYGSPQHANPVGILCLTPVLLRLLLSLLLITRGAESGQTRPSIRRKLSLRSPRSLTFVVFLFLIGITQPAAAVQLGSISTPHCVASGAHAEGPHSCMTTAALTAVAVSAPIRKVATPCRNSFLRADNSRALPDRTTMPSSSTAHMTPQQGTSSVADNSGVGALDLSTACTLLEESVASSSDWAFLSATLLETLIEHCTRPDKEKRSPPNFGTRGDRTSPTAAGIDSPKCLAAPCKDRPGEVLYLANLLDASRCFDVSGVNFRLGCTLDDVLPFFRRDQWDLRRSVIQHMLQLPLPDPETDIAPLFSRIDVFTDGSFNGTVSSWAFLVLGWHGRDVYALGWIAGLVVTDPASEAYIGATQHDALRGEASALFWAMAWLVQGPKHVPVLVWSDCLVALQQPLDCTLSQGIRALCQALLSSDVDFHEVRHVRSHVGHPANEFVDAAAKWACRGQLDPTTPFQVSFAAVLRQGHLDWWWMLLDSVRCPLAWPCHVGRDFTDHDRFADTSPPTEAESREWLGLPASQGSKAHAVTTAINLRLLSVNVQTLAPNGELPNPPGDDKFKGKAAYIREQLAYHGVHIAALQETRARQDETVESHSHVRLCSGRDSQGHYGVELWVAKRLPISTSAQHHIHLQLSDLLVVHSDPRTLIVRLARRGLNVLFTAIHAPTASAKDRAQWWKALSSKVTRLRGNGQVVLLGDFNVHFSAPRDDHIGDLVWPGSDCVPNGLLDLLRRQDLWIPSTFSECHHGPSITWTTPNGLHGSRIDFIAVPSHWGVAPGASQVHHDLDWGQSHVDHYAVRLDVAFFAHLSARDNRASCSIDREALATPEGQRVLSSIWEAAPSPPWNMNVHRHWSLVEKHLRTSLLEAFPSKRGSCRSSHFSTGTWLLRQRRVWLRRGILRLRNHISLATICGAFRAWRRDLRLIVGQVGVCISAASSSLALQLLAADMRTTKHELRQAIRHDQEQRIQNAAAAAARAPPSETLAALRPLLGPSKRRCRGRQSLPVIHDTAGKPATTPEEAESIWIQHFAGVEDGRVIAPADLASDCLRRQLRRDLDDLSIQREDLPTRWELEASLRSTHPGRATGVDDLPGEILHYAASASSRAIRLFQSGAQRHRVSYAIIFLDLREAFYRVIRPLFTGSSFNDELFASAAAQLRLPSDVLAALHRHLSTESIPAAASQWTSQSLSEILDSTWFRFRRSETVVQTGVGSRPGDNCADLVFGYLFACVLQDLKQELSSRRILSSHGASESLAVMDSTWMDDLALMVKVSAAKDLPAAARSATQALVDCCFSRGLVPNFGRGKTEILLVPMGPGSREVKAEVFRDKDPCLSFHSAHAGRVAVRLVTQYQHLGGLIHHTGKGLREARHRVSLAHEAFQKHKTKVFQSPAVPFESKTSLYESLVLSTMLHGAGTWVNVDTATIRALSSAHTLMAAKMLRPRFSFEEALHQGPARILAIMGLPSIHTLLHVARLRQLLPCVRIGMDELWALIHWDGNWLHDVRESLAWLAALVGPPGMTWDCLWPDWYGLMREHPGRWKSLLRKAQAKDVRLSSWDSARLYNAGLLVRQLRTMGGALAHPPPPSSDGRQCCAPCRRIFANYNSWSLHAFKTHHRVMEGRGILSGTQCQACLKHFGTNVKLCRHLRFTPRCRLKLLQHGFSCEVEPGLGSRKAEDPGRTQAPALQAAGPRLPLTLLEVLECLSLLDHDGLLSSLADQDIWSRLRASFSCVCAPSGRLHLTVIAWQGIIDACYPHMRARLQFHLDWLLQSDFVEWLVPDPVNQAPRLCTFQDAAVSLGLLDLSAVSLPPVLDFPAPTFCVIAPLAWETQAELVLGPNMVFFSHEECIKEVNSGNLPSFFDGPFQEVCFFILLRGLSGLEFENPLDFPASGFSDRLSSASLVGDLLRFFVRLLHHGVPTSIALRSHPSACVNALLDLPGLQSWTFGQLRVMGRQQSPFSHLFHLFLN
ncbi:unnamed protein product [Symbiodinium sp. CCMP2592]|nr:unnamed protein product [Symbiodinium sp. CCMP2592]